MSETCREGRGGERPGRAGPGRAGRGAHRQVLGHLRVELWRLDEEQQQRADPLPQPVQAGPAHPALHQVQLPPQQVADVISQLTRVLLSNHSAAGSVCVCVPACVCVWSTCTVALSLSSASSLCRRLEGLLLTQS